MARNVSYRVAVVIPAYRVSDHIEAVIRTIPSFIKQIIVIDDGCPENSGRRAAELKNRRVEVIYHQKNQGVGAAVISGYRRAMELGYQYVVKMDGDGQMDPAGIERLLAPLIANEADYSKGNRFRDFSRLKKMPLVRLFGNSILSFLVKIASGYWNIMDPTNGFTAIRTEVFNELNLKKIARRYFFETDMLINLGLVRAVVVDVPLPARYGDEKSSLSISRIALQFPPQLFLGFIKRIFYKYFIYDFNMASIYILLGLPLFSFGVIFGAIKWLETMGSAQPTPLGTVMLATLPIILGMEMLLQAINIDINSIPGRR